MTTDDMPTVDWPATLALYHAPARMAYLEELAKEEYDYELLEHLRSEWRQARAALGHLEMRASA